MRMSRFLHKYESKHEWESMPALLFALQILGLISESSLWEAGLLGSETMPNMHRQHASAWLWPSRNLSLS